VRKLGILCLVLLLGLTGSSPATAGSIVGKKVLVVLLDGLRLSDLSAEATPNLLRLQQAGAIGVMNLGTAGTPGDVNGYLTINAGSRASSAVERVRAYSVDEVIHEELRPATGRELYVRHFGTEPHAKIVVPQLPQMLAENRKLRMPSQPGLLGQQIHALGGRTAVVGNSDLGDEVHRPAALLAMDEKGRVDIGNLYAGIRSDPERPFGLYTQVEGLYQSYRQYRERANLFVIQTGDLLRVQRAASALEPEQADELYSRALRDADRLVGMLLPEAAPDTLLAIVSPTGHDVGGEGEEGRKEAGLAPVLLAGGDIPAGSVLSSGTTKRTGLLANYDLAPTFLHFLAGTGNSGWLGQVATATLDPHPLLKVQQSVERMLVPSAARQLMVKPWINIWVGLAAVLLLVKLFRPRWLRFIQPLAEAMMILPLSWLLLPLMKPLSVQEALLDAGGLTLAIGLLLQAFNDPVRRIGVLGAMTAAVVVVDLSTGARLLQESVLSYDPVVGARYYGIGNEYMGVLIGATILVLNVLFCRQERVGWGGRALVAAIFAGLVFLFATPNKGTNAGGALAAAVACVYALLLLSRARSRWGSWLLLALGIGGGIAGLVYLNLHVPSTQQTHIGRALSQLLDGQFADVLQIALRKMQLNLLLLRVSAWGKLLVLALVLLLLFGMRTETNATNRFLTRNGKMLLVAALAALLFNDSGVVAAALILLYGVVPLIGAAEPSRMSWKDSDILATERTHKN